MQRSALLLIVLLTSTGVKAGTKYENNFETAKVGSVPEDFLVLDGAFSVKEVEGNKVLELPGSPLDTYGLLFGPTERENTVVIARIMGTAKGRRYPVFDVGLNGVGGYKLRVSPGKKQLEIYKGDVVKTAVPLEWQPGKWTHLKLALTKVSDKEWRIEGTIWQEEKEPAQPNIAITETEAPLPGRASVSGMPYSGQPIWFDDFVVSDATKK